MKVRSGVGLVAASMFGLCAVGAKAADWVRLAGTDDVSIHFDAQSVKVQGGHRTAWLRWTFAKPQQYGGPIPGTYQVTTVLQVANCSAGATAEKRAIYYADLEQQHVVRNDTVQPDQLKFSESAPGTIGETIVEAMCAPILGPGTGL